MDHRTEVVGNSLHPTFNVEMKHGGGGGLSSLVEIVLSPPQWIINIAV